jgi:hypothetical protein
LKGGRREGCPVERPSLGLKLGLEIRYWDTLDVFILGLYTRGGEEDEEKIGAVVSALPSRFYISHYRP